MYGDFRPQKFELVRCLSDLPNIFVFNDPDRTSKIQSSKPHPKVLKTEIVQGSITTPSNRSWCAILYDEIQFRCERTKIKRNQYITYSIEGTDEVS